MSGRARWLVGAAASSAAVFGVVQGVAQSPPPPPKARYVIDVGTVSGFGGNPMAMATGRGGSAQHELVLRLGSTLAPTAGGPHADHFMPPVARLGASVPLETPRNTPAGPAEPGMPGNFQRPKGRLLLFWGCGAHAGPGQPVVIDFAKVAQGAMPPGLFSANVPLETGPTPGNSRTYGSWPNTMSQRRLEGDSSIVGQHSVKGNYSPDIAFSLTQDFMPALNARSASTADGALALGWNAVVGATGYYAWAMGARDMGRDQGGDMVWWTSANAREFGAGLWDWLSPATVARLIGQKVVMPPSQTSCTIPAEVKQAAGEVLMTNLTAYGPEADFADPPRPADPRVAWHPEWTVKVRYRATTMVMAGMPGFGEVDTGNGEDRPAQSDRSQPEKKCKPSIGGLLGGVIGGKGC